MENIPQSTMTTLLDLPQPITQRLLEYLQPSDVLKLRRVCEETKAWVKEFIPPICLLKDVAENNPERQIIGGNPASRWHGIGGSKVVIDGVEKTFDTLASLEYKVSELQVGNGWIVSASMCANVSESSNLSSPRFDECVSRNLLFIRKVTLTDLEGCLSPFMWTFFCALTSMDELVIMTVFLEDVPTEERPIRFPLTFKNLRILNVYQVRASTSALNESEAVRTYHWDLIRFCSKALTIRKPELILNEMTPVTVCDEMGPPGEFEKEGIIGWLKKIVMERTNKHPVRFIDMSSMLDTGDGTELGTSIRKFLPFFLTFCASRNIKLTNVQSHLFVCHNPLDLQIVTRHTAFYSTPHVQRATQASVCSLVNYMNCMNPQHFIGVEYIKIILSGGLLKWQSRLDQLSGPRYLNTYTSLPQAFPNLKEIFVYLEVDTKELEPEMWIRYLRCVTCSPRPLVKSVEVEFGRRLEEVGEGSTWTDPKFWRPKWLTNNFTSVTKLVLRSWDAKNVRFLQVWKGMPQLEELEIKDCRTLGNVGFIGEKPSDPVFLKLKRLKVFTLDLTNMDKIKDRVFKDVFSKMAIKEFNLLSSQPLEKVTLEGIRTLTDPDSEFAKAVEKFSLDFSLAGVTFEELYECRKGIQRYQ